MSFFFPWHSYTNHKQMFVPVTETSTCVQDAHTHSQTYVTLTVFFNTEIHPCFRARIHRIECNVPTLWQREGEKNRWEIRNPGQKAEHLSITEHYYRSSPVFHVGELVSQFCQEQSDNLESSHQGFPFSAHYFCVSLCDWQLEMLLCHDPHDTRNAKAPGVLRWC